MNFNAFCTQNRFISGKILVDTLSIRSASGKKKWTEKYKFDQSFHADVADKMFGSWHFGRKSKIKMHFCYNHSSKRLTLVSDQRFNRKHHQKHLSVPYLYNRDQKWSCNVQADKKHKCVRRWFVYNCTVHHICCKRMDWWYPLNHNYMLWKE